MSPNPPRQQHQGDTARSLTVTRILQQTEGRRPHKEKGRETRCTLCTLGASALCLGSTIILLEERSTSLVVLRYPHRSFWVLTVERGQDFGRKMAQSPGPSLRPLPPSLSCLSQFHLNRTGREERVQNRRHPGCTGSHPAGAGVPRVGEGQGREEPAAAHGEHGKEGAAGRLPISGN